MDEDEREWLTETSPFALVSCVRDALGSLPRPLGFFAFACCRAAWPAISDPRSRHAVEVGELFACGFVSNEQHEQSQAEAEGARDEALAAYATAYARVGSGPNYERHPELLAATSGARLVFRVVTTGYSDQVLINARDALASAQSTDELLPRGGFKRELSAALRDIFGNPFRPIAFAQAWRTETVTALAREVYAKNDFSAMPILADALQDAGCDREEVLSHCRDPQVTHVRGCWVVDALLGQV